MRYKVKFWTVGLYYFTVHHKCISLQKNWPYVEGECEKNISNVKQVPKCYQGFLFGVHVLPSNTRLNVTMTFTAKNYTR